MKKRKFLKELKKLQKAEKAKATCPAEKDIEEACEVLMAHLGHGNLQEEKVDLLMALVAWVQPQDIRLWEEKMRGRGRAPTLKQQKFINIRR